MCRNSFEFRWNWKHLTEVVKCEGDVCNYSVKLERNYIEIIKKKTLLPTQTKIVCDTTFVYPFWFKILNSYNSILLLPYTKSTNCYKGTVNNNCSTHHQMNNNNFDDIFNNFFSSVGIRTTSKQFYAYFYGNRETWN